MHQHFGYFHCIILFITWITLFKGTACDGGDGSARHHDELLDNKRATQVGTNLKLPCTPPDAEEVLDYFTWSKNGVLLPDRSSAALQSRFIIQGDFSLMIERVREDDEGIYTCYIQSNPPRKTSYYVTVQVPATIEHQHPPPVDAALVIKSNSKGEGADVHQQSDSSAPGDDEDLMAVTDVVGGGIHLLKEGTDLDLSCTARGKPPPNITWTYQGMPLKKPAINSADVIHPNQSVTSVHRIQTARRIESGKYTCQADNGVDLPAAATFNVKVSYPPEIVVESNWVHAGLGSFAELVCNVYSQPPAHVTWYRAGGQEDRQVTSSTDGSRIGLLTSNRGQKNILRFKNVRDADLGVYTCRAENELGRAEAAMELSGIAVAAVLRVAPPRDGMNKLTSDFGDGDDDLFATTGVSSKNQRVVYHLIWDVMSHSPVYEYRLWLRPVNSPPSTWINLIIPTSSSSSGSLLGSSSSFLHSHQYILSDLKPGVIYLVSVQSRNRFGWSAESNVLHLSGDPEVFDYHDEQQQHHSPSGPAFTTTSVQQTLLSTQHQQTTQSPVQIIDPVSVEHHGTHEETAGNNSNKSSSPTSTTSHHHQHHHTSRHHQHGRPTDSSPVASPSSRSPSISTVSSQFVLFCATIALMMTCCNI